MIITIAAIVAVWLIGSITVICCAVGAGAEKRLRCTEDGQAADSQGREPRAEERQIA